MKTHRRFRGMALALLALAALPGAGTNAQKVTPAYTFTDLGGLSGLSFKQSEALAINDAGQIVGFSYTAGLNGSYRTHPVLWVKDSTGNYVITDLSPTTAFFGRATGVNTQGEVVGYLNDSTTGAGYGFLIRPATDAVGNKVWYRDLNGDGINDLMTNLGDVSPAWISDNTQIAAGPYLVQFDAVGNEIVTTLPSGGYAFAVNSNRQVAGSLGGLPVLWKADASGNLMSMLALDLIPGDTSGEALCINALGQAAGACSYSSGNTSYPRATLWRSGSAATDLGSLAPNNSTSQALGIGTVNGVLQVVGTENEFSKGSHAFLWKNGVITDLSSLISASGVKLQQASAVNSTGQVVGYAYVPAGKQNTELHGFLLTPR